MQLRKYSLAEDARRQLRAARVRWLAHVIRHGCGLFALPVCPINEALGAPVRALGDFLAGR